MKTAESIVDVRRAGPEDAETVLTMVREIAALEGDASDVVSDLPAWTAMLARPEVVVLVARRDGHPAGYVSAVRRLHLWLGTDILVLDDLYVREGFRDAGVGRLLMLRTGRPRGRDAHPLGDARGQRGGAALLPPARRLPPHQGDRLVAPLTRRPKGIRPRGVTL